MRANIGGVGDLYGPLGPERVLAEGRRILRMLKCWGVGDSWLDLLLRLGDVGKRQRDGI